MAECVWRSRVTETKLSLSPQCPIPSFSGHWRAVKSSQVHLSKLPFANRWAANTSAERERGCIHTEIYTYPNATYIACAYTYSCMHLYECTHTHMSAQNSLHYKITNVLHFCVQALTMWESDLLVRVCSGCWCNQHSPKAGPSHRKSSASSAVTSCRCGKPRRGTGGVRFNFCGPWPDFFCAAVAAAITPCASLHCLSVGRLSPWV